MEKPGVQNTFGINKYQRRWLQHVEGTDTQTGAEIQAKREEKHWTSEEKMEGPASPRGISDRHCA
jgi:hypothetical protein